MGHNDVLVDPNVATFVPHARDRTVSIPHDPFQFAALVVPGLLAGLCGCSSWRPGSRRPRGRPATRLASSAADAAPAQAGQQARHDERGELERVVRNRHGPVPGVRHECGDVRVDQGRRCVPSAGQR